MKKFYILIFLFFIFGQKNLTAQKELSFGLGYPYLSVKYHPLELKYASGEGIKVFAGRFYRNFYKKRGVVGFWGIEAGYINFDTLDIKGSGYEGSLFLGGEYFVAKKLSLALDFSPTFIVLESDDYKTNDIEWVVNFVVYYYFTKTPAQ